MECVIILLLVIFRHIIIKLLCNIENTFIVYADNKWSDQIANAQSDQVVCFPLKKLMYTVDFVDEQRRPW